MAQNVGQNIAPLVALNTDFGHSPVGALGGRRVEQVAPQAPRSLGKALGDFGAKVQQLATRVLNALTPHGVRAEPKFRAGLEATSRQVGELLGALSHTQRHPVDTARAQALMHGLPATAEPVTSRGQDYNDVFRQRLAVNLGKMDNAQLVALRDGVAQARGGALGQDRLGSGYLAVIGAAVQQELMQRLIDKAQLGLAPVLEQSIAETPRGSQAVMYQFQTLPSMAVELLKEHGFPHDRDTAHTLIKEVIAQLVDDEKIDRNAMGAMLGRLSPQMQHDLLHSAAPVRPEVPETAERLLSGAIGVRIQQTETAFLDKARQLLDHPGDVALDPKGPLQDPVGFAREVIAVARLAKDMQEQVAVHDLNLTEGTPELLERVVQHLTARMSPDNLLLGELNHRQLHELRQALAALGVHTADEALANEATRRTDAVTAEHRQAMTGVMQAARDGDLTALLRGLQQANALADRVLDTRIKLGEDIEGGDQIMAFRERLVLDALGAAGVETLGQVFAQLESPQGRALINGLCDEGQKQMVRRGGDPELGRRLFDAGSDLLLLGNCVRQALADQGVRLPPMPDEAQPGMDALGKLGRQALREVFGVSVSDTGRLTLNVGVLSPRQSRPVQENLLAVASKAPDNHRVDDWPTGVSQALWLDLGRAQFSVRDGQDAPRPVLDREGLDRMSSEQITAQKLSAVERFRAVCGDDPELLMKLSILANQNLLAGLETLQLSADSPIRLPDGTPGRLVGESRPSYDVRSDGEGGLLLRADYAITRASHFMDVRDGTMVALDPEHSHARFSLEVHIAADGSVRMSEPVSFQFDLKPLVE